MWAAWIVAVLGCAGAPAPVEAPKVVAPPPAAGTTLRVAEGVRWRGVMVRCDEAVSGEMDVGPEDRIAVPPGCLALADLGRGLELLSLPPGAAEVRCDAAGVCVAVGGGAAP